MIYLSYPDLLTVARRVLGDDVVIRDPGLLHSALARPQSSVFGADAYGTLEEKAAALTLSLVRNHALLDGNKRLGLAALIVFLGMNGRRLTWSNDQAYDVIVAIASGELDDVRALAARIAEGTAG